MMGLISCRETGERMSRRLDGALAPSELPGLVMHLGACRHCRRLRGQMLLLRRAYRSLGIPEEATKDGPPGK